MRPSAWLLLLFASSAAAQSLRVDAVVLPAAEPSGPSLFFAPGDVPALQARKAGNAQYSSFKSFVNGQLGNLATATDDTLSKVAKAAALLHQLGDTPPAGAFTTYRDAAVAALEAVRSRSPGDPLFPPVDPVDVLQDSPRMQSMAEAYDMLRGTGVSTAHDTNLRARIADWADAIKGDYNLVGYFGIAGHRDNWGLKGGAALVTAALAMPRHASAAGWLASGMTLIQESLAKVASATGWYREGPHYLNYSLNGLVSTAYHVQRAAGVDWFDDLAPFARLALDMRQPDGSMAPFEEGVPNVFPFDVLWGRYPELAPAMKWAWLASNKDAGNYENQAIHSVTRFLVVDAVTDRAPDWSPTRFIGGDAFVQVLRSGFGTKAAQATMLTAVDSSDSTLVTSRHHMQNPLDMTVFGAGRMLLCTSGGGPTVTSSPNRGYYLTPASKNVPLVNGSAPYILDGARIAVRARTDSRFLDVATTRVTAYPGTSLVARTLAMVGDEYFIAGDEFSAGASNAYAIPWHGRGARTVIQSGADFLQARFDASGASLDVAVVATSALTLGLTSGWYAPSYGVEETIAGIEARTSGTRARILSVLVPRATVATARKVIDLSTAEAAAARVVDGSTEDVIVFAPGGQVLTAGGVTTDAALAVVRTVGGRVAAFAAVEGTRLDFEGAALFRASAPATMAVTLAADGLVAEISQDQTGTVDYTLADLPEPDMGRGYRATFEGGVLVGFAQAARSFTCPALTGGGRLVLAPNGMPWLAAPADQTVLEGEPLAFSLEGTDPDGDPLRYSMSAVPAFPAAGGPSLGAVTGAFAWTPGHAVAPEGGLSFVVTFSASDGPAAARRTAAITVQDVPAPDAGPDADAGPADAGAPPDAGPVADADAGPLPDSGPSAPDAAHDTPAPVERGAPAGCGCNPGPAGEAPLALLLLAFLGRRRTR